MKTTTTGRKLETIVYNLNNGYKKSSGVGLSISDLVRMANDIGAYMDIIPGALNDEYIIYNHNTDTGKRLTVLDVGEDLDFNPEPHKYIIIEVGPPAFYGNTATATFTDDENIYNEAYERFELSLYEEEFYDYVNENEKNGKISLYDYIENGEYVYHIEEAFRTFLQSTCRTGMTPYNRLGYVSFGSLKNAGIFRRLVVNTKDLYNIEDLKADYIPGQSYPDEIRTIKRIILPR